MRVECGVFMHAVGLSIIVSHECLNVASVSKALFSNLAYWIMSDHHCQVAQKSYCIVVGGISFLSVATCIL